MDVRDQKSHRGADPMLAILCIRTANYRYVCMRAIFKLPAMSHNEAVSQSSIWWQRGGSVRWQREEPKAMSHKETVVGHRL